DHGHYFVISTFLTKTRSTCLSAVTSLLSLLPRLDKSTAQPLLVLLSDLIYGGPEEFQSDSKYDGEPSEEIIQRLMANGFDRVHVYAALMAQGNSEIAALDYLNSRRDAAARPRSRSASPSFHLPSDDEFEQPRMENIPSTSDVHAPPQETDTTTLDQQS